MKGLPSLSKVVCEGVRVWNLGYAVSSCFHPRDQGALGKGDTLTFCHVSELDVMNTVL